MNIVIAYDVDLRRGAARTCRSAAVVELARRHELAEGCTQRTEADDFPGNPGI